VAHADHVEVVVRLADGKRLRRVRVGFVSQTRVVAQLSPQRIAVRHGSAGISGSTGGVTVAAQLDPSTIPEGSTEPHAAKHKMPDQRSRHFRIIVSAPTTKCMTDSREMHRTSPGRVVEASGRKYLECRRHESGASYRAARVVGVRRTVGGNQTRAISK
jgi:hypothetical protein